MNNKVYMCFDTEFSSFDSPKFLSLGAVSSTLAEFYAEVDKITMDDFSDFVRQRFSLC